MGRLGILLLYPSETSTYRSLHVRVLFLLSFVWWGWKDGKSESRKVVSEVRKSSQQPRPTDELVGGLAY